MSNPASVSISGYFPYIIIGKITRDFILTREGYPINDILGGSLVYAAVGLYPWERKPGLVAHIGIDFPEKKILEISQKGLDINGIRRLNEAIEHRNFISFFDDYASSSQNVLSSYFHACQPFPKELLGYKIKVRQTDSCSRRTSETIIARDVPEDYLSARCIHLCPMDFLTHYLIPHVFLSKGDRTITIEAGTGYMQPLFWEPMKQMLSGISTFIVRERELRSLFSEYSYGTRLETMAQTLLDFGLQNIVIALDNQTDYALMNTADRYLYVLHAKTEPDNPEKIGELSCFCGAYLAGLNETYDPLKAAAYGAARVSLLQNEENVWNNMEVLEDLLLERIRKMENSIDTVFN